MFPLLLKQARQKRTVVWARSELMVLRAFASCSVFGSRVVGADENWMTSSRMVSVKAGLIRGQA